jgi:hypothetical protein
MSGFVTYTSDISSSPSTVHTVGVMGWGLRPILRNQVAKTERATLLAYPTTPKTQPLPHPQYGTTTQLHNQPHNLLNSCFFSSQIILFRSFSPKSCFNYMVSKSLTPKTSFDQLSKGSFEMIDKFIRQLYFNVL